MMFSVEFPFPRLLLLAALSGFLADCDGQTITSFPSLSISSPFVVESLANLDQCSDSVPSSLSTALSSNGFAKVVCPFGVIVAATSTYDDDWMKYAANVIANILDQDQDGDADDEPVLTALTDYESGNGGALFCGLSAAQEARENDVTEAHGVRSFSCQTYKDVGSEDRVNGMKATLQEEAFHLVHDTGYALVYPDQFGNNDFTSSVIARETARLQCVEPGWFHPENLCPPDSPRSLGNPADSPLSPSDEGDCTAAECDIAEFYKQALFVYIGASDLDDPRNPPLWLSEYMPGTREEITQMLSTEFKSVVDNPIYHQLQSPISGIYSPPIVDPTPSPTPAPTEPGPSPTAAPVPLPSTPSPITTPAPVTPTPSPVDTQVPAGSIPPPINIQSPFDVQSLADGNTCDIPNGLQNLLVSNSFTKVACPFGILIVATVNYNNDWLQYAANVVANIVDQDEDGAADDAIVLASLVDYTSGLGGALVCGTTEEEEERGFEVSDQHGIATFPCQTHNDLEEFNLDSDEGNFIAKGTIQDVVFDMILRIGYSEVYPSQFSLEDYTTSVVGRETASLQCVQPGWWHPDNTCPAEPQSPGDPEPSPLPEGDCTEADCDVASFYKQALFVLIGASPDEPGQDNVDLWLSDYMPSTKEEITQILSAEFKNMVANPTYHQLQAPVTGIYNFGGSTNGSPTASPKEVTPPPSFCFSGQTVVEEKSRGMIPMSQVQLGDEILAADGSFQQVYSFGHYDTVKLTTFLQFHPSLLEVTGNHLIFVDGRGAIPASAIQIGDVLASSGEAVTGIKTVKRRGMYAPLTTGGTLLVNGVSASSYVSFQGESSSLKIGLWSTGISYHVLSHRFQSVHRLWCRLRGCTAESYDVNTGLSMWAKTPHSLALWFVKQNHAVMMLLAIPFVLVISVFALVEELVCLKGWVLFQLACTAVLFVVLKKAWQPKVSASKLDGDAGLGSTVACFARY